MENNTQKEFSNANFIAKKSWLAYIFPVAAGTFSASLFFTYQLNFFGVFILIWMAYKTLMIRSVALFIDDTGIWVSSGIFPWNKGTSGVRWANTDEAVFYTGFIPWAFNSYFINVTNKFTNVSEILLTHMKAGDRGVERINMYLSKTRAEENNENYLQQA